MKRSEVCVQRRVTLMTTWTSLGPVLLIWYLLSHLLCSSFRKGISKANSSCSCGRCQTWMMLYWRREAFQRRGFHPQRSEWNALISGIDKIFLKSTYRVSSDFGRGHSKHFIHSSPQIVFLFVILMTWTVIFFNNCVLI